MFLAQTISTMGYSGHTVDGRNPAPVARWLVPLFIGFQPSKVVQDFFHPPYQPNSINVAKFWLVSANMLYSRPDCHISRRILAHKSGRLETSNAVNLVLKAFGSEGSNSQIGQVRIGRPRNQEYRIITI
jgi:hypothetical protein